MSIIAWIIIGTGIGWMWVIYSGKPKIDRLILFGLTGNIGAAVSGWVISLFYNISLNRLDLFRFVAVITGAFASSVALSLVIGRENNDEES